MSVESTPIWRLQDAREDSQVPYGNSIDSLDIYKPEIYETITKEIVVESSKLRELSLDIHSHPELKFQEIHAHDALTNFLLNRGWDVKRHHLLDTAWVATFEHGVGGKTLGINSEMDALPGIGHACGHNLIAIAGVAVALGTRAALEKHDIAGKVILLGTPAEEGGAGKVRLLEMGAYEGMDACLMCHPGPGPKHGAAMRSSLALQRLDVMYRGHTAHAALSPWEAQNALDAAVAAYNNIALLRQQIKPFQRVHGVFGGQDWTANIIPDNATMHWYVRSNTKSEVEELAARVRGCFEAAALATGCAVEITVTEKLDEVNQNKALGDTFSRTYGGRSGPAEADYGKITPASTDFGNITYALPSIHPFYSIPTLPNGGNHTAGFTAAAQSQGGHDATLEVAKALALTGVRVLADADFLAEVKATFEDSIRKSA
ncbi:hypothetical protein FA95DRAFT_1603641 [Auriscalpium vulgare]|uniref:Uncharacterized protein n=1 Tax=Auriscalpium vulgare TaxID=40419 RepID=A0ACB8S1D6_9AGAM|nr:hypothetical protein FA95DRAFT_1603641 [Auriscalpium vulgare]